MQRDGVNREEEGRLPLRRLSRTTLYAGSALDYCRDRMQLPDGSEETWDFIHHRRGGGACVIPVTEDGRILMIRQYRPEVIVVQDFRGEYGNGLHKLTAALTAEAVEKAADSSVAPESAAEYGPWQVKKLYVHLYEENQIRMDWDKPLGEDGIITPMFLAREAYDRNRSQTALYTMDSDGKRFDNTLFGLYYTAVGPDVQKDDFLENIR